MPFTPKYWKLRWLMSLALAGSLGAAAPSASAFPFVPLEDTQSSDDVPETDTGDPPFTFGLGFPSAFDPVYLAFIFNDPFYFTSVDAQFLKANGDPASLRSEVAKIRVTGTVRSRAFQYDDPGPPNPVEIDTDSAFFDLDLTYAEGVEYDPDSDSFFVRGGTNPLVNKGMLTFVGKTPAAFGASPVGTGFGQGHDLSYTPTFNENTCSEVGGTEECTIELSVDPYQPDTELAFQVFPGEDAEGDLDGGEGVVIGSLLRGDCDPNPDLQANPNFDPGCTGPYGIPPLELNQANRPRGGLLADTDVPEVIPMAVAPVFDPRRPGSALVYPLFDVNNDPGNARTTTIKLSNLGDDDVWVHLVRVCAGVKSFGGEGLCQASNRQVELTPGETFVRDVASFFSIDRDNCPTGYIVAYAQLSEGDKQPKIWNHLIGSVHMNSAGSLNQRTSGLQAYGFQATGPNGLAVRGSSGGLQPALPFDGIGYAAPATTYSTDYLASIGQRYTELTLMTLDIEAGFQNEPTFVALDAWNQKEEFHSGGIEYVCHVRVRLDDEINAAQPGAGVQGGMGFGKASNLGSSYGLLQMTPLTGDHAILGATVEMGGNRQTLRGLWHDDEARPTTFYAR